MSLTAPALQVLPLHQEGPRVEVHHVHDCRVLIALYIDLVELVRSPTHSLCIYVLKEPQE